MFHFIEAFLKNYSDMCDRKTAILLLSVILLPISSFCIYITHTEKAELHSEIKNQSPCEDEYKEYCLKGEYYFIVDEDIVDCSFS